MGEAVGVGEVVSMQQEQSKQKTGGSAAPRRVRRKLATVLAADVANFSAMVAQGEEATVRELKSARRAFDSRITYYGGRIANTAGDSVVAIFDSPVLAVRCAIDVQQSLANRRAGKTKTVIEPRVQFRIGVHTGDVLLDGRDVLGDAVNLAARLEGAANPGAIAISQVVREHIGNRFEDIPITNMGQRELKNIPRPVQIYELLSPHAAVPKAMPQNRRVRMMAVMIAAVMVMLGATGLGIMAVTSLQFATSLSRPSSPSPVPIQEVIEPDDEKTDQEVEQ